MVFSSVLIIFSILSEQRRAQCYARVSFSFMNWRAIPERVDERIRPGWIAVFIGLAMLFSLLLSRVLHQAQMASHVLLAGVLAASLPLFIGLLFAILLGNFSVDLLAALSILTSLALREYWVAAIIILMLAGGGALEDHATRRASSVLNALARRMPQIAHLVRDDGSMSDIAIDEIAIGQRVRVFPHEICPVDGTVVSGEGSMDESYLTGEPFLIEKTRGATVLSGAINGNTALTIQATKVASDSRYAKIVEVLHASEQERPRIRRLGDRIGGWNTPLALVIASLAWLLSGHSERFLAVLVIATPCPLLIAIPVAVIGAISVAARRGILVKDSSILEKLESCRILVVDKTGTLTYGKPKLREIIRLGAIDRDTRGGERARLSAGHRDERAIGGDLPHLRVTVGEVDGAGCVHSNSGGPHRAGRRHAAVARARARRRRPCRLARRQPAQVVVHARRSQRVVLPAHGLASSGVRLDARVHPVGRRCRGRST